jgi:hypothetical protein
MITPMADYILFDDRNADGSKDGSGHYAFTDKAEAEAFLDSKTGGGADSSDLASLIVGKTLYYQHCNHDDVDGVEEITFGSNGKITYKELDGDIEEAKYDIDGNVITTYEYEDGQEEIETHTLIESTDKYIKFKEENGDITTFYYSKDDALNSPADDCDGDDDKLVNDLVSGNVTFKDSNDNTLAVPADAWVRITPEKYQVDGNWNGINCKVNASGSFGEECYLEGDEAEINEIKDVFKQDNTTYQIVVYKNHIEPSKHHWDCGEDVYRYVGGEENSASWQNIMVYPENYQDRSNEECN